MKTAKVYFIICTLWVLQSILCAPFAFVDEKNKAVQGVEDDWSDLATKIKSATVEIRASFSNKDELSFDGDDMIREFERYVRDGKPPKSRKKLSGLGFGFHNISRWLHHDMCSRNQRL